MKFQVITEGFQEANVEALAVAVFKDEQTTGGILKDLDELTGGNVASVIKSEEFKGEAGDVAYFVFQSKDKKTANRLLLVGVGEREDYGAPHVAVLAGAATRHLLKKNVKSFALAARFDGDAAEAAACAAQGVMTSHFELDKYKTIDKKDKKLDNFVLFVEVGDAKNLKNALQSGEIVGDSMNFARDLANEPPNILH
ncbi:MAG: hypothetical protein LH472_00200, partial [Pyrinomonadaceae bacterium]|nr:hypothetical protein [Pyrinomonadaceae bacterium]